MPFSKNKLLLHVTSGCRLAVFCCAGLCAIGSLRGRPDRSNTGHQALFEIPDSLIISKIIIKGSLKDKDRYQRVYALEPGEFFDKTMHEKSLDKIRVVLEQNGYLANTIDTSFAYREKTKKVDVILTINPGQPFIMDDIAVQFMHFPTKGSSPCEKQSLSDECQKILTQATRGNRYEKKATDTCLSMLKDICHNKGFFNVVFTYDVIPDKKKHTLSLIFKLDFEKAERYLFFGNTFFQTSELFKSVAPFTVPLCIISPETIVEDIVQLYKDSGFFDCTVLIKKENEICRFIIREGLRFKIAHVEINGSRWADKKAQELFSCLNRQIYDADLLRRCFDNLKNWYEEQGFWDFSVEKYTLSSACNPDEKTLTVTIREGAQKFLAGIRIEQFPEIMNEHPFVEYKTLKKPIPFNKKILTEQHDWLAEYLQKQGYLYAAFESQFKPISPGSNNITVAWQLTGLANPVQFGKTFVTGNSRVSASLLLNSLVYKEGDIWDAKAVDKSLDRLKSLSVFKSVSLQPADFFVPEPSKKMILKIIEDDPYELSVHAGLGFLSKNFDARGNGITYRLGGGFLCRNPAHRGDIFRIDGDLTRYVRCGALDYTVPLWSKIPMTTGVKVYGEHRDQPFFIGSPDILYTFLRAGGMFRFSGTYEHLNWNIKSNVEWLKIEGLSPQGARVLQFEPALLDRMFPYFVVEPVFSLDYLDDPIRTQKGSFTNILLKGMFPFTLKDAWIVKIMAEQSFFYPLASWLTLALRLRMGTIANADFERIMPPERFYLGGADSLRGYSPDFAPPLNRYIDSGGTDRWVPIGGKSVVNANIELRFPLYGNLGGALFTDMGFLSQHGITSIMSEKLLGSNGFGLRYTSPVGVFRFDMGWKWKRDAAEDRSFAWFLSLGNVF